MERQGFYLFEATSSQGCIGNWMIGTGVIVALLRLLGRSAVPTRFYKQARTLVQTAYEANQLADENGEP